MFRALLITMLVGLACASYSESQQTKRQQQNNRPAHADGRRPVHRRRPHTIVALDQVIKRKPAIHFLGRHFVAKALASQQGNKYLKLSGKEQRDINGVIQTNKSNTLVNLMESKTGHFLVQNKKQQVVGRVDMYSGNRKYLTVKREKNGDQSIQGYNSGSGSILVEKDLIRRGRNGAAKPAKKHLKLRVNQSHYANGNIQIVDLKAKREREEQQQEEVSRYRREAVIGDMPIDGPCNGEKCLKAVQM